MLRLIGSGKMVAEEPIQESHDWSASGLSLFVALGQEWIANDPPQEFRLKALFGVPISREAGGFQGCFGGVNRRIVVALPGRQFLKLFNDRVA
jgi:hypothetical protein